MDGLCRPAGYDINDSDHLRTTLQVLAPASQAAKDVIVTTGRAKYYLKQNLNHPDFAHGPHRDWRRTSCCGLRFISRADFHSLRQLRVLADTERYISLISTELLGNSLPQLELLALPQNVGRLVLSACQPQPF